MASPTALPPALQEGAAGWEALDPARIAIPHDPDGVRDDVPFSVTQRGPNEVRAYLMGLFGAFTELASRFTSAFVAGDRGAVEWSFTGTYTGQVPGFPPGTGQTIALRGADVLELRDGLIVRDTAYYDVYAILQQLGVVPAPGGSPVASPAAT